MSNPWNPQNQSSGDPETSSGPSEPHQPSQHSSHNEPEGWPPSSQPHVPPGAGPAGTPFSSGSAWPGSQPTAQTASYDPRTGEGGGHYPPNDFTFIESPASSAGGGSSVTKRITAGALVVALMLGSGATGALIADNDDDSPSSTSRTTATVENASSEPASQTLAKVAAAVQPSVVSIQVTTRGGGGDTGSGFILHNDGTIVTNNHVISAAANSTSSSIAVKFFDGETATATIVGRDPSTDLAVIKVNNVPNLVAANLGSSNTLHVGDTVLALGSPLGLEGSVSSGIVSALHRTVELGAEGRDFGQSPTQRSLVADAIQTDAAINPGNSGGPLVDINGKVVGVNTAIASLGSTSSQSGSIGVGFAIPVDEVQSVAEQLIRGETPKHALLGVQISDDDNGALIQDITSGGAAEKAGLQVGDVVTKFDDRRIDDADALSAAVRTKDPDQKVSITYERDGQTKTTEVTLGSSTE
jgi:putative serine protease PepD